MIYEFKYRRYAEALYAALGEDPFYATMAQSVDKRSRSEAMIRYMDYSMVEAERYGRLQLSGTDGPGASIWAKPIDPEAAISRKRRKTAFLNDHMGPASTRVYQAIVDNMSLCGEGLISATAWYLSILGVEPACQGSGLGARLVGAILERTDRLGVPTYLETFTPRSIPFYRRLGYSPSASFREPTTDAEYVLMTRSAGPHQ